jgi:hypothetical protein
MLLKDEVMKKRLGEFLNLNKTKIFKISQPTTTENYLSDEEE